MFTLQQISDIHKRLGSQGTLFQYLEALKAIGVGSYDSFIADGHSEYYGDEGQKVSSPALHEKFAISETGNRDELLKHLDLHTQGVTDYIEMVKGLAQSGIEKWTFDTNRMTIAYCDKEGRQVLIEAIENLSN